MDQNDILQKVISLTASELEVDEDSIDETTEFKNLGADSFDLLELVTAFEEEFGATLDDDALQDITTVADAVDAISNAL